jgi:acyl dehydratase
MTIYRERRINSVKYLTVPAFPERWCSFKHANAFFEVTGDRNPLHFDPAFAAKTKFGRLVVQGGLTTGLLHALVAMDMPGPGTVFLSQNWKFTAPVFIGDTITAEAEVLSIHPSKPVTQLKINVKPDGGETVLAGRLGATPLGPRPERNQAGRCGPGFRACMTSISYNGAARGRRRSES